MKNEKTDSTEFINTKLYEYLHSFYKTMSQDITMDHFKQLINALKFAILNGENPAQLCKRIRRERYYREPSIEPLKAQQAVLDIEEVKRLRRLAKAKPLIPGGRKLDIYRQEIVTLRKIGASQMDIKYWLLAKKGVSISQPTLHRYLTGLEAEMAAE